MFPCFTREEYERKLRTGESLPQEFIRIEQDGTSVLVILPSGEPAMVENPRMRDSEIQFAVNWLADLLEYYYVDLKDKPTETPFSNLLQCEDAFSQQHATEFEDMIKAGLVRLESWLEVRTDGDHDDLVSIAKKCIMKLRKTGF